jgi:hypothetical protein
MLVLDLRLGIRSEPELTSGSLRPKAQANGRMMGTEIDLFWFLTFIFFFPA